MRESLKKQPDPIVCKEIFEPAIADEHTRSFQNMIWLNLAHVLMLQKQGIIHTEQAKGLCRELVALSQEDGSCIGSDPRLEDYYFNFEAYIIQTCGMETGGALHTARSRNDLNSTLIRMNVRKAFFETEQKLEGLISAILELAARHTHTVMTGYTHMQPAQPITFAHYLTGVTQGLLRDRARWANAFGALNLLPLGACAFAGTSFPIDRAYVAELLGFDGVLHNSIDSIASRDYLLEIAADCAILGTTLSRFTSDLYVWATDEFGYLSLDDALSCCSSIMPQKRNPLALEHIKAKTAHLIGCFTDLSTVLRSTPYGHCRDLSEMNGVFWNGLREMNTSLDLLTAAIRTITVHQEKMAERTDKNYSTVTELADTLVRQREIPFRQAHHIVGNLVRKSVSKGLSANQITAAQLDEVYFETTGEKAGYTDAQLRTILSGRASVENRQSLGAPSPENCEKMIAEQTAQLQQSIAARQSQQGRISCAYENLMQQSRALI